MLILNLGAGKKLLPNCVNIDVTPYPGMDMVVNLSVYPWPWASNAVSGIHVSHLLEHFADQERFLRECHRILKPGGFLRIVGPHASCISSVGCLGHYRTYAYNTFHQYLSEPFYMFKKPLFETIEQRLNWWYEVVDAEGNLPGWTRPIIKGIDVIMNRLIALSPRLFENVFCSFIQCREVVWKGRKLHENII